MHDLWRKGDRLTAFACAEKIAPYLYARLALIEQKVEAEMRRTVINAEPLSIEESDRLYGVERDEAPTSQDSPAWSNAASRAVGACRDTWRGARLRLSNHLSPVKCGASIGA